MAGLVVDRSGNFPELVGSLLPAGPGHLVSVYLGASELSRYRKLSDTFTASQLADPESRVREVLAQFTEKTKALIVKQKAVLQNAVQEKRLQEQVSYLSLEVVPKMGAGRQERVAKCIDAIRQEVLGQAAAFVEDDKKAVTTLLKKVFERPEFHQDEEVARMYRTIEERLGECIGEEEQALVFSRAPHLDCLSELLDPAHAKALLELHALPEEYLKQRSEEEVSVLLRELAKWASDIRTIHTDIRNPSPEFFKQLAQFPNLCDIACRGVTDEGAIALQAVKGLTRCDIRDNLYRRCDITDKGLEALPNALQGFCMHGGYGVTEEGLCRFFSRLLELKKCEVIGTKISDRVLEILSPALEELSIGGGGQVTPAGLTALFRRCGALRVCNIYRLAFNNMTLESLPPRLEKLRLDWSDQRESFSGVTASGLAACLARLEELKELSLHKPPGVIIIDAVAANLPPSLERLTLRGEFHLTEEGIITLFNRLQKLKYFSWSSIEITDRILAAVPATMEIFWLNKPTEGHHCTAEGVKALLGRLRNIKECRLDSINVADNALLHLSSTLENLSLLRCFDLTGEGINALLPRLTELKRCYFSDMKITDETLRLLPLTLKVLILTRCEQVTKTGLEALRARLPNLIIHIN